MRQILLFIFFLLSLPVFSQYTLIPDEEFERFLIQQRYDWDLDGQVLTSNIASITELNIYPGAAYKNIKDLTGIEDFASLEKLNCDNCFLTNLDLSKNIALRKLFCKKNKLTNINLSNYINLETINYSGNQISILDVSTNINLTTLVCQYGILANINLENAYY